MTTTQTKSQWRKIYDALQGNAVARAIVTSPKAKEALTYLDTIHEALSAERDQAAETVVFYLTAAEHSKIAAYVDRG